MRQPINQRKRQRKRRRGVPNPDFETPQVPIIGNTYIDRHVPQRRALAVVAFNRRGQKLISFALPVPQVIGRRSR
jgi:hypothetical protein